VTIVRYLSVVLGVIVALVLVTSAFAGMRVIEYKGGVFGKVIFDGKLHNEKLGPGKCMECHKGNVPFAMKMPGTEGSVKITPEDHISGSYCGTCHNGTKAFTMVTGDFTTCAKCHKPAPPVEEAPAEEAPVEEAPAEEAPALEEPFESPAPESAP